MSDYSIIGKKIIDIDRTLGIESKKCECGLWFHSFKENDQEFCHECLDKKDKNLLKEE